MTKDTDINGEGIVVVNVVNQDDDFSKLLIIFIHLFRMNAFWSLAKIPKYVMAMG